MTPEVDTIDPIVNLNGTSPEALIKARLDARAAILATIKALHETAPNGRDYIGQPLRLKWDTDTHRKRIAWLDRLYNTLEDEAIRIQDQQETSR